MMPRNFIYRRNKLLSREHPLYVQFIRMQCLQWTYGSQILKTGIGTKHCQ